MFEGSGTSTPGFRAEVEAEQALERGEGLLGMVSTTNISSSAVQQPQKPKLAELSLSGR
jgi:hypothetical protein